MNENEISAQGIFDAVKLLDKDLIDKILAISKAIQVEKLEDGITRITIDLVNPKS